MGRHGCLRERKPTLPQSIETEQEVQSCNPVKQFDYRKLIRQIALTMSFPVLPHSLNIVNQECNLCYQPLLKRLKNVYYKINQAIQKECWFSFLLGDKTENNCLYFHTLF